MSTEAQRPPFPELSNNLEQNSPPAPHPAPRTEAPQAAPPPPPPPVASARFPDAPPTPAAGIPVDPELLPRAQADGVPGAADSSGTAGPSEPGASRSASGRAGTVPPASGVPGARAGQPASGIPPRPATSPPPGIPAHLHAPASGPATPAHGDDAPPRPDGFPGPAQPAPGERPSRPAARPAARPAYDIPLLPADRPDDDSGTVALGRGAGQAAPGTAGTPGSAAPAASRTERPAAGRSAGGHRAEGRPAAANGSLTALTTLAATFLRQTLGRPSAPQQPGAGSGPFDTHDDSTAQAHPARDGARPRAVAAAACVVLGLGLIGGAVTGSWLTGDSSAAGAGQTFSAAAGLWHNMPVDQLFPPVVRGRGAGPGGADRTWTRIAVAPDSGCAHAFDPLLHKALAPVGCRRLLRATYTDATRSHVTTVGLLFTKADAAAMRALQKRFADDGLDRRPDLMPRTYAARNTVAAGFGDAQRASWTVSVRTDAPVVVYAVSGFADGRTVPDPQPAATAVKPSAGTTVAQAGLGHEAKGLTDRVERGLRKAAAGGTPQPAGDTATDTEQH